MGFTYTEMLSLNGMSLIGVNPITKPCRLRPKTDNIILVRAGCYTFRLINFACILSLLEQNEPSLSELPLFGLGLFKFYSSSS
jgi:hypothetical protein